MSLMASRRASSVPFSLTDPSLPSESHQFQIFEPSLTESSSFSIYIYIHPPFPLNGQANKVAFIWLFSSIPAVHTTVLTLYLYTLVMLCSVYSWYNTLEVKENCHHYIDTAVSFDGPFISFHTYDSSPVTPLKSVSLVAEFNISCQTSRASWLLRHEVRGHSTPGQILADNGLDGTYPYVLGQCHNGSCMTKILSWSMTSSFRIVFTSTYQDVNRRSKIGCSIP